MTAPDRAPKHKCRLCPSDTRRPDICFWCEYNEQHSDRNALTGGQWVQIGLTRVWVSDPETRDPDPAPEPVTGVLCHCGCLLRDETESCPACLAWAEKDAIRASWINREFYQPIKEQAA